MSKKIDVTNRVNFYNSDDECLPLTRCVCGKEFRVWEEIVSIYTDNPWECPSCGRKLFFSMGTRVFEIQEDENDEKS